nr:PRC and DUF2382 domain-containing protein [Streptacidiphilus neutrinimicus]
MQTEIDPRDLIGHKAVDKNGEKIGTVDEVYLDDATGQPEWAAVRTGLFGRDAFVPLTTSEFVSDELRVPYEKALVKDSPDFGVGQHLSPAQELQLYRYYGLEVPTGGGQHAAEPGVRAGEKAGEKPSMAAAGSNGGPATVVAGAGAGAAGAAAGMAAGRRDKPEHEKPAEQTLTTPTVQPLANAGRTSSFMTGSAPHASAAQPQPGMAGPAAAAAPAAAAVSSPSAPTVRTPTGQTSTGQTSMGQTSTSQTSTSQGAAASAAQAPTVQTPTTQTPPPAPFPAGGAGMGVGMGAGTGTAASSSPETQRRPDPLTDPLPGLGLPASSADAGSKNPVPEPLEIVCREERLDISTEWHVLGRARLRKYVTSEQVERRVPVVRERIRVERVPVGAEERAQLTEAEIAESVEEVTLHEERLVVKKTVVPVERIRLVTERVTEEEVVREQLHREHIQVQDGSKAAGTPVTPAGSGANGGYSSGSQPSPGQSPSTPLRTANPTGTSRNPDLPGHALGA